MNKQWIIRPNQAIGMPKIQTRTNHSQTSMNDKSEWRTMMDHIQHAYGSW